VLELGSFLNNDRWTVQFGVGHTTEVCNVHVHNVMFIEFRGFKKAPGFAFPSYVASLPEELNKLLLTKVSDGDRNVKVN